MDNYAQMSLLAGKLLTVVSHSLAEIKLEESELATAALCIKYAAEIDNGNLSTLAKVGPLLLSAMEALQMTPRSRALAAKGVPSDGKPTEFKSKLDELRERRNSRKNGASDLDTATS